MAAAVGRGADKVAVYLKLTYYGGDIAGFAHDQILSG
jgi:hypothetical protein